MVDEVGRGLAEVGSLEPARTLLPQPCVLVIFGAAGDLSWRKLLPAVYLGKETVQNLLVLRFANSIFEPLWNQKYVDHVQITVAEEEGLAQYDPVTGEMLSTRVRLACRPNDEPGALNLVAEEGQRLVIQLEGVDGAPRTQTLPAMSPAELIGRRAVRPRARPGLPREHGRGPGDGPQFAGLRRRIRVVPSGGAPRVLLSRQTPLVVEWPWEETTIELTEQQQGLEAGQEEPPRVFNPRTRETFVLVPADVYERLQGARDEDGLDMRQVAVLVEQAMREDDEGDPALETYQKYRNPS
jgi:hypothetical protein